MRKISMFLTVLITSFVVALAGLVASPIATASENDGSISATFASGSSVLTKAQKAAIRKALATSGTDVTYTVTGTAGKQPGVSNRSVKALAKARANAIKAYLVSLGVSKSSIATQTSTTEIGVVPKSTGSKPTQAVTDSAGTGSGSGSSSGGVISVAAIAGVTAPVTGATRVTTTTARTGYTGAVTWSPSAGTTFASATTYTATITLTPTSGYTLTGVAANFFTVAGATPVTNSVNAGVITAAFPATATTISVAAIAGVTAPVTSATPVTTTTAGTGYTGTVAWSGSPATFVSATTYTATITLTPTSGYTLTGVAANFFTVAGATPVTNSVNAGVVTAAFPATATTLAYAIGDTGPGGGKVFYRNAVAFTCGPTLSATCNYLEAAPTTGLSAWTDANYAWSGNTSGLIGAAAQGTAVGTGYKNTLAIIAQTSGGNTASKAATIAQAYGGPNSLTDWYLASSGELRQMCKWANAQAWTSDATACTGSGTNLNLGTGAGLGAAGFIGSFYHSSTEREATRPNGISVADPATDYYITKDQSKMVRPIRAF
jgi:hypothetical protein